MATRARPYRGSLHWDARRLESHAMQRHRLLRVGIVAVAIVVVSTCAAFRSPHQGFLGGLGSGLVLLLVLSAVGGLVVGGLASAASRPLLAADAAWFKVFGFVGQSCVWLSLTPPLFYLLVPIMGLYGLLLAFPCAVLIAGAWGLLRGSLFKWEPLDSPLVSPWSLRRTLVVASAAVLVLFEVLDVGRGRFGSRLLGLLAALDVPSTAVGWLGWSRWGFLSVAGALGFYWAFSRLASFPPFIRAALFAPRLLVALGLDVAFSVWSTDTIDLGGMAKMLPDALALVGCWSYLHASWESRQIARLRDERALRR
jgi:hypothetical protein